MNKQEAANRIEAIKKELAELGRQEQVLRAEWGACEQALRSQQNPAQAAEEARIWAKLEAAQRGEDDYAKWMKRQAEVNRQKDEARSQAARVERERAEATAQEILRQLGRVG